MEDPLVDPQSETSTEIVYDDDPIEMILYGGPPSDPTLASIFAPARLLLEELKNDESPVDASEVLTRCSDLLQTAPPLTPKLYQDLCEVLVTAVRNLPGTDEYVQRWQAAVRVCVARELKNELPRILCGLLGIHDAPQGDA